MKIFILVLLFSGIAFSQNYEVNPVVAFDDTVTWVSFSDDITVNLGLGTASWRVYGKKVYRSNFDSLGVFIDYSFFILVTKKIIIPYTGQAITRNGQKNASAAKFDLIYTGAEQ